MHLKLLQKLMHRFKQKTNTIDWNLKVWSEWDWSKKGEEWSNSLEWKHSLIEYVLKPNIPFGSYVLEIGPGAGRWTEYLVKYADHLTLVDLVPECIELCKKRFHNFKNIEYYVNNGQDLSFISESSLDRIWSFDVFVHIQAKDVEKYIHQFARLLKSGGQGVIHHSRYGKKSQGWRSDMTAAKMVEYCRLNGLEVIDQFNSWDNNKYYIWPSLPPEQNPDIITLFSKPK